MQQGHRTAKLRPMLDVYGLWVCCFYVPLESPSYFAQDLWIGRDLYRATPAVTRGLSFSGLIRRTATFSCLLGYARGCRGPILTRILMNPHSASSYDTQGDAEDLFLSESSRVLSREVSLSWHLRCSVGPQFCHRLWQIKVQGIRFSLMLESGSAWILRYQFHNFRWYANKKKINVVNTLLGQFIAQESLSCKWFTCYCKKARLQTNFEKNQISLTRKLPAIWCNTVFIMIGFPQNSYCPFLQSKLVLHLTSFEIDDWGDEGISHVLWALCVTR
jgi:hypothetical protein